MLLKKLFQAVFMALGPMYAVTPGSANPQQPSSVSEQFLPDQLIAGRYPLMTAQGSVITGASALQRGAVMGKASLGSATVAAGTPASGTITFAAIPAAADTLTIQGTAITFKAAGTILAAGQFSIGYGSLAEFLDALVSYLNASADVQIAKMTYAVVGGIITATSVIGSTTGNAYTLAKVSAAITLSGATLAGGVANTGTGTCVMDATTPVLANARSGIYSAVCTVAGTNAATFRVSDPLGRVLVDKALSGAGGTLTVADQLKFVITDAATDFAVGDQFLITVAMGNGKYKLSTKAATDGSQVPSAILADYADPSSGDVYGALYIAGEFNLNALNYDASWDPHLAELQDLFRDANIYLRSVLPATGTVTNH